MYLSSAIIVVISLPAVFSNIPDLCDSHTCPKDQVCRVETIVCVTKPCPGPKPVCRPKTNPGSCPIPKPGIIGPCFAECSIDADCEGGQKCCGNCPRVCTNPIQDKPGLCPRPVPGAIGPCVVRCSSDSSCPGDQKCCGSCPRDCTPPEKPGFCPNPSGGLIGICIAECTLDSDCNGDQKCCGGCPRKCVSPLKEKPGTCPQQIVVPGTPCQEKCKTDRDCEGDLKCCGRCPRQCVAVAPPAPLEKPGFCPLSSIQQSSVCRKECKDDFSCPRDSKCCSSGCSRICQRLLLEVPYADSDPCKGKVCGRNEVCKLQEVVCVRAPCYPTPVCVRKRPEDTKSVCSSGYPVLAQIGKPIACNKGRSCPDGTLCVKGACCWDPAYVKTCPGTFQLVPRPFCYIFRRCNTNSDCYRNWICCRAGRCGKRCIPNYI